MTIDDLIENLQSFKAVHGNLEVLLRNTNNGTIRDCPEPTVRVVDQDEFPLNWNMPAGFTFVQFST